MNKLSFEVHPDRGSISVHMNDMNPSEIRNLIDRLNANLSIILREKQSCLDVLSRSVRLERSKSIITFHLDWNAPPLVVDLDNPVIPEPNIPMFSDEYDSYCKTISAMIAGV